MSSPKHIAIILDGNRRFAKRLLAKPWKGHEFGAKKVKQLLQWCSDLGIHEVTLYAFSVENFSRPREEFDYLMRLFKDSFAEVIKNSQIHDQQIRINFLGRTQMFPEDVQTAMRQLSDATKTYNRHVVNFCMAYGGRHEIVDAARKMVDDVTTGRLKKEDINEQSMLNYLYSPDEPDMIIRTGGEKRLSGFLLYASSYSELFFLEKTWPEFEKDDLIACLEEFKQRERRFGR
jgi:tritrans,polycis-undecaprenyl-diphosphate synthase [geranylgeranyl-diphosphate specific]